MTREELGAFLQRERMRGKLFEIKLRGLELEQRYMEVASPEEWRAYVLYKKELEKRNNHNHDNKGRFASANSGAGGLSVADNGQKSNGFFAGVSREDLAEDIVVEQFDEWNKNHLTNAGESDKIKLPEEDPAYGDCSSVMARCKKTHVKHNPVKTMDSALTEQEIIDKVGGGDMTKGSCASAALAYAANKAGYDVLDFRGGNSLEVFSSKDTWEKMSKTSDKWVYKEASTSGQKIKYIKSLPEGKEYIFMTKKHAAIVKQIGGKAYFLELQEPKGNGWIELKRGMDLDIRFGFQDIFAESFCISVEDMARSAGFRDMMGYINTPAQKQQKGAKGHAK